MGDGASQIHTLVASRAWCAPHREAGFSTRSLAAAASRFGAVDVVVPGEPAALRPDGGFDLLPIGNGGDDPADSARTGAEAPDGTGRDPLPTWPAVDRAVWSPTAPYDIALLESGDAGAAGLLSHYLPSVPTIAIVSTDPLDVGHPVDRACSGTVAVGICDTPSTAHVGCHVPAHALAAAARHVGMGFTDYVLVLSDRGPRAAMGDERVTPLAAWVAARFARRHVVVIENAVASVWRARSLRGLIEVNTRMDLWRIMAHARMTVDLAPGTLLARECVESLRYAVPIVVPAGTAAARLAHQGGGLSFTDPAELLDCISAMDDQRVRDDLGQAGRATADSWYGTVERFIARLRSGIENILAKPPVRRASGYADGLPGSRRGQRASESAEQAR